MQSWAFTRAPLPGGDCTSTPRPRLWETAVHFALLSASTLLSLLAGTFQEVNLHFHRERNWVSNSPQVTQRMNGIAGIRPKQWTVGLIEVYTLQSTFKKGTTWLGSLEPKKLRCTQFSSSKGEVLNVLVSAGCWPLLWPCLWSFHVLQAPGP